MGKYFLYSLVFFTLLFTQCAKSVEPQRYNQFVLATICQITLYDEVGESAADRAFEELARIESVFSRSIPSSDVATFNRLSRESAGEMMEYDLTPEVAEVLSLALDYGEMSRGKYNPAVGPLVDLWGIGTDDARVPLDGEIVEVLPLLNLEDLNLDGTLLTALGGTELDLGSIAKGYAADRVKLILEEEGVERAIVNLGGNVLVMGNKPDRSLWKIGIQNPLSDRGDYVGIISMESTSMVTSGNYERFFEVDGVRYHHILDGNTGYPVENNLAACTIVTPRSIDADALSTTLYSLGLEEGMAFAEAHDYFEVLFITKDNKIYLSSGLEEDFQLTNGDFTLSRL
ncbi:MAG: FAD:protein FMN transferase [Spirochaetales bacterium]|nr:FAD:protein FMN transferase [Spirochaetales bacterium]